MALRFSVGVSPWCSWFLILVTHAVIWVAAAARKPDCLQSLIDNKVFNLTTAMHTPDSVKFPQMLIPHASNHYGQYDDELYTDTYVAGQDLLEEAAEQAEEDENDKKMTVSIDYAESSDARSAFINNQYVPDDGENQADYSGRDVESQPNAATASPFYTLLQQQMQQLLSSSSINGNRSDGAKLAIPQDMAQVPPNKPLFGPALTGAAETSDYTEQTELDMDNSYKQEPFTNEKVYPAANSTTTQRMQVAEITVPAHPYHIETTTRPSIVARPLSAKRPFYKKKRPITFKTVSTATQFVSTPLAELMLKYTIGIAKPAQHFATTSKPDTVPWLTGITKGNAGFKDDTAPKRRRPRPYQQEPNARRKPKAEEQLNEILNLTRIARERQDSIQ